MDKNLTELTALVNKRLLINNNAQLFQLIITKKYDSIKRIISESTFNIDGLFVNGLSPLHIAIKQNDYYLVQLFLNFNANVNNLNVIGDTPLNFAILNCDNNNRQILSIFLLLLKSGANINQIASNLKYPIENAVTLKKRNFIQILLCCKADDSFKTLYGHSLLHLAMFDYHPADIVRILLCNFVNPNLKNNLHTVMEFAIIFRTSALKELLYYNLPFDYREYYVQKFFQKLDELNDDKNFFIYHLVKRSPNNLSDMLNYTAYNQFLKYFNELNNMQSKNIYNSSTTYFNLLMFDMKNFTWFLLNNEHCKYYLLLNEEMITKSFPLFSYILLERLKIAIGFTVNYYFLYKYILIHKNSILSILAQQIPIQFFQMITFLLNENDITRLCYYIYDTDDNYIVMDEENK